MNYKTKSARMCHALCRLNFRAALHESICLYGFSGVCASCATYFIKLFNKYITALVGSGALGMESLNTPITIRNLAAQVARVAQIAKRQGDI